MRIPYFIWFYKVESAVPGWSGWRKNVRTLDILEKCDFFDLMEEGCFDVDPWTPEEMIEYNVTEEEVRELEALYESPYPMCEIETQCRCCKLIRAGKPHHRHSGLGQNDSPIHLPS